MPLGKEVKVMKCKYQLDAFGFYWLFQLLPSFLTVLHNVISQKVYVESDGHHILAMYTLLPSVEMGKVPIWEVSTKTFIYGN